MVDVEDNRVVRTNDTALHFATRLMINVQQMEHVESVVRVLDLNKKVKIIFEIKLVAASSVDWQVINFPMKLIQLYLHVPPHLDHPTDHCPRRAASHSS